MLTAYIRAMDALQRACMIVAGTCLVVITVIIPWGVFTRYVLGIGSSWPEPLAVLLMIWFSFLSAAICYRENLHIGVAILPNALTGWKRTALGVLVELLMAGTNLFILVYGVRPGEDDLVSGHRRFPDRLDGRVLPARAARRRRRAPLRHRAAVARDALRHAGSTARSAASRWNRPPARWTSSS